MKNIDWYPFSFPVDDSINYKNLQDEKVTIKNRAEGSQKKKSISDLYATHHSSISHP